MLVLGLVGLGHFSFESGQENWTHVQLLGESGSRLTGMEAGQCAPRDSGGQVRSDESVRSFIMCGLGRLLAYALQ